MTQKLTVALLVSCATFAATGVQAQDKTADGRWTAWYGCWRPAATAEAIGPEHMLCILPSADGATFATVQNDRVVSEQVVSTDGVRRPSEDGGCKGLESASWSADARRVFLHSDLDCGGNVHRKSSGAIALITPASYVDVQTVEVDGQKASRTIHYIEVPAGDIPSAIASRIPDESLARESARMRAAAPLDLEDVVEASRAVGSETTNGVLVARRNGFPLDASHLRMLAQSGVQPSTVDVMVALTYPEHFEVADEAPKRSEDDGMRNTRRSFGATSSCYDDFGYGFGRAYDYGYAPFGRCGYYNSLYSPYGYDAYGWGYRTSPVIVVRGPVTTDPNETNGSIVKGKGYTRSGAATGSAKPRDPQPATRSTGTGSAGASTGSVRSAGSSSGSSGSSSTPARTAKPRSGGGGGGGH